MAIGDAVALLLGTGTVNRQPASGVEDQISYMFTNGTTDDLNIYDGTNTLALMATIADAKSDDATTRNQALMITNSVYLRKTGTTDFWYIGGVQTNV